MEEGDDEGFEAAHSSRARRSTRYIELSLCEEVFPVVDSCFLSLVALLICMFTVHRASAQVAKAFHRSLVVSTLQEPFTSMCVLRREYEHAIKVLRCA